MYAIRSYYGRRCHDRDIRCPGPTPVEPVTRSLRVAASGRCRAFVAQRALAEAPAPAGGATRRPGGGCARRLIARAGGGSAQQKQCEFV